MYSQVHNLLPDTLFKLFIKTDNTCSLLDNLNVGLLYGSKTLKTFLFLSLVLKYRTGYL